MPYKPNRPCAYPGCSELIPYDEYYCKKHKIPSRKDIRSSSSSRGYNYKWQKESKRYLELNPLCVRCKAEGKYINATVVDHIIPHKGNEELFWDKNNWQPLCKKCHDRKTITEDINRKEVYHY